MTDRPEPIVLHGRTFARSGPGTRRPWPEDGLDLWSTDPRTQFYVASAGDLSRCALDLPAVVDRAQREVPMGYRVLLGCQKTAVVQPDGDVTRWEPVPDAPEAGDRTRYRPTDGRSAWGYHLVPGEDVPNWTFPAYPARYLPTGAGLDEAVRDATAVAARAGYPVVVGLVLLWIDWH